MDCAGAALSVVAPFFCSRKSNVFPEAIEQRGPWIELETVLSAIDPQRDRYGVL
jgi:hypothetical protein